VIYHGIKEGALKASSLGQLVVYHFSSFKLKYKHTPQPIR